VRQYRIQMAVRFRFDPRQVDAMTCQEFDEFAAYCDTASREEEKQKRESERSSAAGRRRSR
jgi:hypothetical protein